VVPAHGVVDQPFVASSIDPRADRAAAVRALQRDFPGSIRRVRPSSDVQDVGHLHAVPWLIAALIGALALATLVHALATMLGRHRSTLAVASAMGFTRGQRRQVGVLAGTGLVAVSVVIGIPAGILVGARVWRGVADSVGVPSGPVVAWLVVIGATVVALAVATTVAVVATRGAARMNPAELLRVE
jgi:ABC-type lipoprotein release transport system permease subunit